MPADRPTPTPPNNEVNPSLPGAPLRYACYARVSTDDQADRNLSIPAQLRECRAFVQKEGGLWTAEFSDPGFSGTTMDRPGLQEMLTAARQSAFDVLVIQKSDRLSREDLAPLLIKAELAKHGIRIRSVSEPFYGGAEPLDEMMETIARGFNKLYISNLKKEIKKGQAQMAVEGRQSGHAPFGYRFVNKDVPGSGWSVDEEAAVWVRRVFARVLEGATFAEICREMNAAGVTTPSLRHARHVKAYGFWTGNTLRNILKNRVYLGEIRAGGQWQPGSHPPVVDKETWARVEAVLSRRSRGRAENTRGLFTGQLLRCPRCGALLTLISYKDRAFTGERGGRLYRHRYACTAGRHREQKAGYGIPQDALDGLCTGYSIGEKRLIRLLQAYLIRMAGPEERGRKKPILPLPPVLSLPVPQGPARDIAAERLVLEKEIAGLPGLRAAYQAQQAAGYMTMEELGQALATLSARREALEAALAQLSRSVPPAPITLAPTEARSLLLLLDDPAATPRQTRDALKFAFSHFVPWPDKSGLDVYPALTV